MERRDNMKVWACLMVSGLLFAGAGALGAMETPRVVSPGSPDGTVVNDICPTFSWGDVEEAASYELVVYEVSADEPTVADATAPVLRQSLPAGVSSWTPPMPGCLVHGSRYAWSLRAKGNETASAWSVPSLFEVEAAPSREELAAAIEVVKRYLDANPASSPTVTAETPDLAGLLPADPAQGVAQKPIAGAATGPQLSVEGDVSAADYFVSPSQEGYLGLPGNTFLPESSAFIWIRRGDNSNLYPGGYFAFENTDRAARAFAPVQLPNGVIVTQLRCYFMDGSEAWDFDIRARLVRRPLPTPWTPAVIMAEVEVSSFGNFDTMFLYSTSDITDPRIVNQNNHYFVEIRMTPDDGDLLVSTHRHFGCRITYTFDRITN